MQGEQNFIVFDDKWQLEIAISKSLVKSFQHPSPSSTQFEDIKMLLEGAEKASSWRGEKIALGGDLFSEQVCFRVQ